MRRFLEHAASHLFVEEDESRSENDDQQSS